MSKEPTLIIQGVVAALTAAQWALPLNSTWHGIFTVALIGLGAVVNRSQVQPK